MDPMITCLTDMIEKLPGVENRRKIFRGSIRCEYFLSVVENPVILLQMYCNFVAD